MARSRQLSLSAQSIILILGRTTAYLFSLLIPVALVRIFTQEQFGVYRQVFLLHATIYALGQMGLGQSLYYFLPRNPDKKDLFMWQTSFLLFITGVLSFLVLSIFKGPIADLFHSEELIEYLPLLALYSLFTIASSFLEISMIAERQVKLASLVHIVSQFIYASSVILAGFVTRSILVLLYATIGYSVVRFIFLLVYLCKRYPLSWKRMDPQCLRNQLSYSIPVGLANLSFIVKSQLHRYFVSYFFNPVMFAIYEIGCIKARIVNISATSVSSIMIPQVSVYEKEKRIADIVVLWKEATRKLSLFIIPSFIFLLIMTEDLIVTLFTPGYKASVPIFRINLISILILAANPGTLLRSFAETKFIMKLGFWRLPVEVVCLYVFIKNWGVLGAVLASNLTLLFFWLIMLIKAKGLLERGLAEIFPGRSLLQIVLVALISAFPLLLLKTLDISPVGRLAGAVFSYPLFYLLLGIRTGVLTNKERRLLQELGQELSPQRLWYSLRMKTGNLS